jgi:uncharacterized OB-fold protein
MTVEQTNPQRPVPALTPETTPYFTGGLKGELLISTCATCAIRTHPPLLRCPSCGEPMEPRAVSGDATVASFTVNHYAWHPAFPPPYVVAIVALDEDPSVHITTNIIGCDPDDVTIGQQVRVVFEVIGEEPNQVALPMFVPRNAPKGRLGVIDTADVSRPANAST